MRILHAPRNVANQAWEVAVGLRSIGHDVDVWQYGENPYGFPCDRHVPLDAGPRPIVDALFAAYRNDYDVLHFHFGRTLVPARYRLPQFHDLALWRALDKPLVFTFHGSDVRLRSVHAAEDEWSYFRHTEITPDEPRMLAMLQHVRAYADLMIVANVLNRRFVPEATYVPKGIDVSAYEVALPEAHPRVPVVVHAPSHRGTKGTRFVLEGIETLRRRGVDVDLRLLEGLDHGRLIEEYARADVVVDHLLAGDAGVTSLEAMAMGKVAVARVSDEVLGEHPDLPVVSATPDTFADRLLAVLEDRDAMRATGISGRRYVERTHASDVVAARLVHLYEGIEPRRDAPRVGLLPPGADEAAERTATLERRLVEQTARAERLKERTRTLGDALEAQAQRASTYKERAARLKEALDAQVARAEHYKSRLEQTQP